MADVVSTLRGWSATAASNLPAGTTTIGTNLDDNLREIQAVVRKYTASLASNMASATTVDLSTADGYYVQITGTTTITGLGTESAGIQYLLRFAGALTLTYNATSLILPTAASIKTAAGDLALMISEGSGNWRCVQYTRANSGIVTNDGASGDVWLWTRALTGAKAIGAGPLNGYSPSAYMFDIYTDDADAGSDFLVGARFRHRFGGAATKGGREALSGTAELIAATHASNANRNYVGVQGKAFAMDDDNGTNTGAGALGAVFGGGFAVYADDAATNLLNICGAEFNTFTDGLSSAKHMSGIAVVGCQATRGAAIDAAISVGAQAAVGVYGPHVGWKHGIVFTDENGADPFYASSTLIGAVFQSLKTIAGGIDLSGFTMTSFIMRGIYSKITESQLTLGDTAGNAQIDIVGASTNASLLLRSRGTGSLYFQGSDATNIFRGDRVASSVNYIAVTPAVTTGPPAVSAVGTDTNIDLQLQCQGSGVLRFGTHTGGADTTSNGYITIKDAAGNTRKLMTTA